MVWRVVVWDRKTGDSVRGCDDLTSRALLTSPPQVLSLSSTDGNNLVGQGTQVVFLDEFRMAVVPYATGITELTVFNTLVPSGHPGDIIRLGLPQRLHGLAVKIRVDHDRPLGMPIRDEPYSNITWVIDPSQQECEVALELGCTCTRISVTGPQKIESKWTLWGSSEVVYTLVRKMWKSSQPSKKSSGAACHLA